MTKSYMEKRGIIRKGVGRSLWFCPDSKKEKNVEEFEEVIKDFLDCRVKITILKLPELERDLE